LQIKTSLFLRKCIGHTKVSGNLNDNNLMWWAEQAACKSHSEYFFEGKSERELERFRREAIARQICASCDVFNECKIYISHHSEYGFWAGQSEDERSFTNYGIRLRGATRSTPVYSNKTIL
jgi:WhiB family redox-sensing transcriptional regulator